MKITREWLDSVSDEKGLTRGQQELLAKWVNPPIVGATIPDQVAKYIEHCRGYRGMPQHVHDLKINIANL